MDAREVIARIVHERSPTTESPWSSDGCDFCFDDADAILAALAANQLAVVGREPTDAMVNAGYDETCFELSTDQVSDVWRAMFDAISPSPVSTGDRR